MPHRGRGALAMSAIAVLALVAGALPASSGPLAGALRPQASGAPNPASRLGGADRGAPWPLSERLLRLRGGKSAVEVDQLGPALEILEGYSPRKKTVVARGVPKQPRASGQKMTKQKGGGTQSKSAKAVKKTTKKLDLHEAPWRYQAELDIQGDTGWYNGRQIEVRRRTKEGNHILRVGYVGSRKSEEASREKLESRKAQQEGLWERQEAIKQLKAKISLAESAGGASIAGDSDPSITALRLKLAKRERELVRYKDAMDGTVCGEEEPEAEEGGEEQWFKNERERDRQTDRQTDREISVWS
jgi:hypothetical protein